MLVKELGPLGPSSNSGGVIGTSRSEVLLDYMDVMPKSLQHGTVHQASQWAANLSVASGEHHLTVTTNNWVVVAGITNNNHIQCLAFFDQLFPQGWNHFEKWRVESLNWPLQNRRLDNRYCSPTSPDSHSFVTQVEQCRIADVSMWGFG